MLFKLSVVGLLTGALRASWYEGGGGGGACDPVRSLWAIADLVRRCVPEADAWLDACAVARRWTPSAVLSSTPLRGPGLDMYAALGALDAEFPMIVSGVGG